MEGEEHESLLMFHQLRPGTNCNVSSIGKRKEAVLNMEGNEAIHSEHSWQLKAVPNQTLESSIGSNDKFVLEHGAPNILWTPNGYLDAAGSLLCFRQAVCKGKVKPHLAAATVWHIQQQRHLPRNDLHLVNSLVLRLSLLQSITTTT